MSDMVVSWFSAGVSSAVATKMVNPDMVIYIDIDDQHPDTYRFLDDCQEWFGQEIVRLRSPHGSVENACRASSFIKSPAGAVCTRILKRRVRQEWQMDNQGRHTYVWGFDGREKNRAERTVKYMPEYDHLFPLLDKTKAEVHGMLQAAGIPRPQMYKMGYPNNNCVGCLKGGMGYWNQIRRDFPDVFADRAKMERDIGANMLKECYLDELDPERGRNQEIIMPDCGIFCDIDTPTTEGDTNE